MVFVIRKMQFFTSRMDSFILSPILNSSYEKPKNNKKQKKGSGSYDVRKGQFLFLFQKTKCSIIAACFHCIIIGIRFFQCNDKKIGCNLPERITGGSEIAESKPCFRRNLHIMLYLQPNKNVAVDHMHQFCKKRRAVNLMENREKIV